MVPLMMVPMDIGSGISMEGFSPKKNGLNS